MGIFNHEKEKINYLKGLISIIVPVYNEKDTLERCLKSLISQSYKNIEIICIDDASTDASLLILEAFAEKDERIKIIKNKENKGIAYCRNIGLKSAVGEYIMWCDSDDWYEKDMCKEMYLAITENNADLVNCSQNIIKDKSLKYRLLLEKYYNWDLPFKNTCVENINDIFNEHTVMPLTRGVYIDPKGEEYSCDKCGVTSTLIYFPKQQLSICSQCFLRDIELILKVRASDFNREKCNNIECK